MEGNEIESSALPGRMDANIPPTITVEPLGVGVDGDTCEEEEWTDRPDHPLKIDLILRKVFKQLKGRDLKECRLVCQTWNIFTIPFTRKAFPVTIFGNHDLKKEHRIDNFLKVFGSNKLGIPFARFKLESFCTTDGVGQEFLQLCGNTIQSIKFLNYWNDKFRVEDLSEILKSTLTLEALEIPARLYSSSGNIVKLFPGDSKPRFSHLKSFTFVCDNRKERNQFCPTFLEELITAAGNISCLNLWDSYPDTDEENPISSTSFEVLSLIEKFGREPSLQELNISPHKGLHSAHVDLLSKMAAKQNGLKLRRLQYETCLSAQDEHLLQIISLFKNTLESITINGNKVFINLARFPKMTRLAHLSVAVYTEHEYTDFRYVNLSKIFPVLETLYLCYPFITGDRYEHFFQESEPCPTVKSLRLVRCSLIMNGFTQLLTVFPNLIDLRVNIEKDGEEILKLIWTQMISLECLHICGSANIKQPLDCVFTGIPTHVLSGEIGDVVRNLERMTTEVEKREAILKLTNQHSNLPSIRNLTVLRSLKLDLTGYHGQERVRIAYDTELDEDNEEPSDSDSNYDSEGRCKWFWQRRLTHLTDMTAYLGFYSIKNLKELILENCKLTKICCEMLTKDLALESWTFKSPTVVQDIIPPDVVYRSPEPDC